MYQVYCMIGGVHNIFLLKGVQPGPEKRGAATTVEVHFKRRKGEQDTTAVVLVRTKVARGGRPRGGVVDLLVELLDYYGGSTPGGGVSPY